jgi:hypothetical protein
MLLSKLLFNPRSAMVLSITIRPVFDLILICSKLSLSGVRGTLFPRPNSRNLNDEEETRREERKLLPQMDNESQSSSHQPPDGFYKSFSPDVLLVMFPWTKPIKCRASGEAVQGGEVFAFQSLTRGGEFTEFALVALVGSFSESSEL